MKNRKIMSLALCLCIGLLSALLLTPAVPVAQAAEVNSTSNAAGPVITQQPTGSSAAWRNSACTYIRAEGAEPLTYKWYYRMPGETEFVYAYSQTSNATANPSYSYEMTNLSSGMEVYCIVTDVNGNSTQSNIVRFTLFEIRTQPAGNFAGTGKDATASVVAVGEQLSYLWYAKFPGAETFTATDCTSATYALSMNSQCSGTQVYCVITDANGKTIQSETATLSLLGFISQPTDICAAHDSVVILSAEAEGEKLEYYWSYRYDGNSTTYSIGSGNNYAYNFRGAWSGILVHCTIYNKYGMHITSESFRITQLAIDTQPTGACAASGKRVSTTVAAQGEELTYQWYVKDPGQAKFTKSSNTTDTYSFKMTKEKSGRQVYCVVTNKWGHSIKSETAKLSLLAVRTQPKDAYADSGKTASTTVKATGSGLKYTWYVKNPGSDTFSKSSVTKATYSYKMTKSKSGREVYCVITDKYGNSVQTETITMKLKETVKLTGKLKGMAAGSKETVSVTVGATGDGLKYTWYVKDPGSSKYTKSSVKTDTYSYTMTSKKSGRRVYCVVTDRYGNSVKTNSVVLSMINITKEPASVTLDAAGKASTSIKVSGKGMTYQWYVKNYGADSFSKSSATGTTYSCKISKSSPSRQVYCVITDKYGNSVQTKTVTLKIKDDVWREKCWWCGGDGRCDDCGGDGKIRKWMPGTNRYENVRCTNCNLGRCRKCGGDGWE